MSKKSEIRDQIKELNLPAIVLEIFDGHIDDPTLGFYCKDPYYSLSSNSGYPPEILPLWECGIIVTSYSKVTGKFILFDLEAPDDYIRADIDFKTLVEDILILMWEAEEPDEYLRDLASKFLYDSIDALLIKLETEN